VLKFECADMNPSTEFRHGQSSVNPFYNCQHLASSDLSLLQPHSMSTTMREIFLFSLVKIKPLLITPSTSLSSLCFLIPTSSLRTVQILKLLLFLFALCGGAFADTSAMFLYAFDSSSSYPSILPSLFALVLVLFPLLFKSSTN